MNNQPISTRATIAALLMLVIGAAGLIIAAITGNTRLHVPPAIALVAAFTLLASAVRLACIRWGRGSSGDGFAALICIGFTAIGGWIAFGPGARVCALGAGMAGARTPLAGTACRAPFGIGAVITALMGIYALLRWLRARRSARDRTD